MSPPCIASVIVWWENKNVTMSGRFIDFILTVKQSAALAACVLRATTEKRSSTFSEKKCIRWLGLRIFRPRNDLASLLRWRLHLMTCLTTLVTWKWPGCVDILAPPLHDNKPGIPKPFGICLLGNRLYRNHLRVHPVRRWKRGYIIVIIIIIIIVGRVGAQFAT